MSMLDISVDLLVTFLPLISYLVDEGHWSCSYTSQLVQLSADVATVQQQQLTL